MAARTPSPIADAAMRGAELMRLLTASVAAAAAAAHVSAAPQHLLASSVAAKVETDERRRNRIRKYGRKASGAAAAAIHICARADSKRAPHRCVRAECVCVCESIRVKNDKSNRLQSQAAHTRQVSAFLFYCVPLFVRMQICRSSFRRLPERCARARRLALGARAAKLASVRRASAPIRIRIRTRIPISIPFRRRAHFLRARP